MSGASLISKHEALGVFTAAVLESFQVRESDLFCMQMPSTYAMPALPELRPLSTSTGMPASASASRNLLNLRGLFCG